MNKEDLRKRLVGFSLLINDANGQIFDHLQQQINFLLKDIEKIEDEQEEKKWEPKPGELCWFWDDADECKIVDHFLKMRENGCYETELDYWSHCSPYDKTHLHWIKNTGEMPGCKCVLAKFSDGTYCKYNRPRDIYWGNDDSDSDIVEYCIIEE